MKDDVDADMRKVNKDQMKESNITADNGDELSNSSGETTSAILNVRSESDNAIATNDKKEEDHASLITNEITKGALKDVGDTEVNNGNCGTCR